MLAPAVATDPAEQRAAALLGVAAAEQDDSGRSRDEEALHPADNPQASEVNRHDMLLGLLDLEKVTVND